MGSINAQVVAKKISDTIGKKKKVVLGEILRDTGYSKQTSLTPSLVTNTVAFQKAMELERKPLLEGLQREINEIKLAMSKKNKNKEEYRTLVGSLDILVSNYQLLSGGATQRQVFVLPGEVMEKNIIEQKSPDVNSINGSTEPHNE